MKRNHKIKLFWGSIVLVSVFLFCLPLTNASQQIEYTTIHVSSGDTLWSIAKEYGDSRKDLRDTVQDIMDLNGMSTGNIRAGQELKIPQ